MHAGRGAMPRVVLPARTLRVRARPDRARPRRPIGRCAPRSQQNGERVTVGKWLTQLPGDNEGNHDFAVVRAV